MSLESELFNWLHENLPADPRLAVGLGDDAAVLTGFDRAGVVEGDEGGDTFGF